MLVRDAGIQLNTLNFRSMSINFWQNNFRNLQEFIDIDRDLADLVEIALKALLKSLVGKDRGKADNILKKLLLLLSSICEKG